MKKLLTTVAIAALCCAPPMSYAAVTPNSIITPQALSTGIIALTTSPGTYVTLFSAGANGSKCYAMYTSTNDQAAFHPLTWEIFHSASGFPIGFINISAVQGLAAHTFGVTVDLMSYQVWPGLPRDNNGNPHLDLVSGDSIKATYATALTGGDSIDWYIQCNDL